MATSPSLVDLSKGRIQCRMATSPPLVDLNEDQIHWKIERERGESRERREEQSRHFFISLAGAQPNLRARRAG